jgi:Rps23 Pro-64 3,4-dihydroxylase Tpa1-like proline 4-hydroxylase
MRSEIVEHVYKRLVENRESLVEYWNSSQPVKHFLIDDLLPSEFARSVADMFPKSGQLKKLQSMRESKWIGVEVEKYEPLIGEVVFAFQHEKILNVVSEITGIADISADPSLYASGVSLMERGDFLNPHLDNSHDGDRELFRVLNALYYLTPDWRLENGGNLELWEPGIRNGNEILSKFNRLVVMATDKYSWHSVNQVKVDEFRRCVSNYYFSPLPPGGSAYSHVTTFSGRPDESTKGLLLRVDGIARNAIRRIFPRGITATSHRRRP